jgi:hypothetical protein
MLFLCVENPKSMIESLTQVISPYEKNLNLRLFWRSRNELEGLQVCKQGGFSRKNQ